MSEHARNHGTHQQLARDCWNLIKALMNQELQEPPAEIADLDDAARNLIEMACDSAVESERIARGFPPAGSEERSER